MDISSAGVKEGVIKALKVVGYICLSGAVAALIAYAQNIHVDATNVTAVALVGLVNALLAGLQRWLTTQEPKKK